MPRTSFPTALTTHLQSDTPTPQLLVQMIRRDGVILGLTPHDSDIVYGGVTYKSMDGVSATAMQEAVGASINNLEVVGILSDSRISEADIRAGKYDGCEIWGYVVNYKDLTMGSGVLFRCYIGKIDIIDGKFVASVEDLMQKLAQQIGSVTSATCRVRNFGDLECDPTGTAINIASRRSAAFSVTAVSTDGKYLTLNGGPTSALGNQMVAIFGGPTGGTFTLTSGSSTTSSVPFNAPATSVQSALNALSGLSGVVCAGGPLPTYPVIVNFGDNSSHPVLTATSSLTGGASPFIAAGSNAYDYGRCMAQSGANLSVNMQIKNSYAGPATTLVLFGPFPYPVSIGDTFKIEEGCDRTWVRCKALGNFINFHGEPHVPGNDAVTKRGRP